MRIADSLIRHERRDELRIPRWGTTQYAAEVCSHWRVPRNSCASQYHTHQDTNIGEQESFEY